MIIKKAITLTALSALILTGCSAEKAQIEEDAKSVSNEEEEKQIEEVVEVPEEVNEKSLSSDKQLESSYNKIAEYFSKEEPPEADIIIEVTEALSDRSTERARSGEVQDDASQIGDFLPFIVVKFEEVVKHSEQEDLTKISTEILNLAKEISKEISKETEDEVSKEDLENLNGKYIEMVDKIILLNYAANPNFYDS